MGVFFGRKQERPIGVDVSETGVRLLQLTAAGDGLAVVAAAFEPLPAKLKIESPVYHEQVKLAVQRGLRHGKFRGQRCVSVMPGSMLLCKNLRLPPMPADELASAVEWEAADRFRIDRGRASVQFINAGEVSQGDDVKLELIVMASQAGLVEAHVSSLIEAGLRPAAVDCVPAALARIDHAVGHAGNDARVVIELGNQATQVLIYRDRRIQFFKSIDGGLQQIDASLSGELKCTLDEAIARREDAKPEQIGADLLEASRTAVRDIGREIGLCLRYFGVTFRGSRPAAGTMIGVGATAWLAQIISDASGFDLQVRNPLAGVDTSAVVDEIPLGEETAWAVAAGLSLRELRPGKKPATRREVAA